MTFTVRKSPVIRFSYATHEELEAAIVGMRITEVSTHDDGSSIDISLCDEFGNCRDWTINTCSDVPDRANTLTELFRDIKEETT